MTSPRTGVRAAFAIAGAGALAAVVLVVTGVVPGGRWSAIHAFTLVVLSPLVLALSQHFGATLTGRPDRDAGPLLGAFVVGSLALLVGLPAGSTWAVATGATLTGVAVLLGYLRLRQDRKRSLGARFAWVVRLYERAHGSFLHGALLGALMGTGVLRGDWYAAARLAHLHVNVLGWAGLTLLATLPFFGPTILRRRIEPGADHAAMHWTRHGATGLSVGVLALLGTGVGGVAATVLRLVAAAGVALLATAAVVVVRPVVRTALRGSPAGGRWPLAAACVWFALALVADVVVVATGAWQYLGVVEAALLLGGLVGAIHAAVLHLLPLLVTRPTRAAARSRLERRVLLRTGLSNLGALLLVEHAALGPLGVTGTVAEAVAAVGWTALVLAVLGLLAASARAVADQHLRPAATHDDGTTGDAGTNDLLDHTPTDD